MTSESSSKQLIFMKFTIFMALEIVLDYLYECNVIQAGTATSANRYKT